MNQEHRSIPSNGQVVVVTGAGSGIGRAIAQRFAASGANVLVHTGHHQQAAKETCDLVRRHGVESQSYVADLSSVTAQDRLVEFAWEWHRRIDVLVNSAGVDVLTGPNASATFDDKLQRLWQVDVTATVRLSRAIGAQMRKQGGGAIVNIGWDQATEGMAGDSGEMFSATKGAIMAFSKSLAQSLAPHVRVNCVAPGWIKTAWGDNASQAWQQRAVQESLVQRWGTPADVADVVCFLASPQASFINGQIVNVNGGWRRSPTGTVVS